MEIKLTDGPLGRNPDCVRYLIVHCSATPRGRDIGAREIRAWHLQRGFNDIGYHFVVRLDGTIEPGRPLSRIGAHCLGKNSCSIGICYVGGVESDGKTPADTRTGAQRRALDTLIVKLRRIFPRAEVRGHRDFAAKACPSFNATAEYARRVLGISAIALGGALLTACGSKKNITDTSIVYDEVNVSTVNTRTISQTADSEALEINLELPVFEVTGPDSTLTVVRARSAVIRRTSTAEATTGVITEASDSTCASGTSSAHTEAETRRPAGTTWLGTVVSCLGAVLLLTLILKSKH